MLQGKLNTENFYEWYKANYLNTYNKDTLYKVILNNTLIGYGFFDKLDLKLAENSDIYLTRVVFISRGCIPTGYRPKHKDHLIDGYELYEVDKTDIVILQSVIDLLISEIKEFTKSNTTDWAFHINTLNMYNNKRQSLIIHKIVEQAKTGIYV